MIQRTILEWQSIGIGEAPDEVPALAADRLAAVASASRLAGQDGAGVLEHRRKTLRGRGVVGVVAAMGCALEILPKIDFGSEDEKGDAGRIRRRLVHMLAAVMDLEIDAGQVTPLDWQRETLLEILIKLFSEKLIEAVRQGMPRRYVEHMEDLSVLRGRLDVSRQFRALAATPSRLACRYDALTPNIALNQVMKAVVSRLSKISQSADNQHRLRELAFAYADIESVSVPSLRWDLIVLDRTNGRWRELLNLAKLLLGERFQSTSGGSGEGFSLLFEMNTLFEEYVARALRRALAQSDLHVVTQGGKLYCLETDDGRGLFQTRPDILVKRGSHVVQVIDTKWKRIAARIDDPKQGVAQSDVYQMMAYGRLYQCDQLTLLYPHHARLDRLDGVQSSHRIFGSGSHLDVATIDIGRSEGLAERLRQILGENLTRSSAA